jgi:hypothetical protein
MSIEDKCYLETLRSRIQPLLSRFKNFWWLALGGRNEHSWSLTLQETQVNNALQVTA